VLNGRNRATYHVYDNRMASDDLYVAAGLESGRLCVVLHANIRAHSGAPVARRGRLCNRMFLVGALK